jgi:hypothetical protein
MNQREVVSKLRGAREVTMAFGPLVAHLTGCPTCGAERGMKCVSFTWADRPQSNQLHRARSYLAGDLVEGGVG